MVHTFKRSRLCTYTRGADHSSEWQKQVQHYAQRDLVSNLFSETFFTFHIMYDVHRKSSGRTYSNRQLWAGWQGENIKLHRHVVPNLIKHTHRKGQKNWWGDDLWKVKFWVMFICCYTKFPIFFTFPTMVIITFLLWKILRFMLKLL